jgi:hypothetical protein
VSGSFGLLRGNVHGFHSSGGLLMSLFFCFCLSLVLGFHLCRRFLMCFLLCFGLCLMLGLHLCSGLLVGFVFGLCFSYMH